MFNVKYREFTHEFLNTANDSFMFCDVTMEKPYHRKVDKFVFVRGGEISLNARTASFPDDEDVIFHYADSKDL